MGILPFVDASIISENIPSPYSLVPITWNSYLVLAFRSCIWIFRASGGFTGSSIQLVNLESFSRYLCRIRRTNMKLKKLWNNVIYTRRYDLVFIDYLILYSCRQAAHPLYPGIHSMVTANVPELDTVTFRGACGVVLSISNADLRSKNKSK